MVSVLLPVAAFIGVAVGTVSAANPRIVGPYGNVPPVYPSPNITGVGGWAEALIKAETFLAQLTLEEKSGIVTGTTGPCVGNVGPITRLGFKGICIQDGPVAVREADYVSVFPAGITTAASWDRLLMYARGVAIGAEFKGKGAHVATGPVAGPLGRSAWSGRNWEGFSPDPYLTGVAMEQTIGGMQSSGVQATAKHFIVYEQETQRIPTYNYSTNATISITAVIQEAYSSNVDDRTMHELYLWPFANAVRSGVASVMCSYNRINGSYACENSKSLNGLLKEELGFQGYVMSDWGGTHSGMSSVEGGLDMDMGGGLGAYGTKLEPNYSFFGGNITAGVLNGTLPVSRLDDMVKRIMTPYYLLGQDINYPTIDISMGLLYRAIAGAPSSWVQGYQFGDPDRDVRADHNATIRAVGAASTVLLKNVNNALPLKAPKSIGVFGNDAGDDTNGAYALDNWEYGTIAMGAGSGTGRFTYLVSPLEAIKAKARNYGALVQFVLNNTLINSGLSTYIIPKEPDVCLVFTKTFGIEASDRTTMDLDWDGNDVVESVAAVCSNTVVVIHSPGANNLPWSDHPNVTAILAAHYPGQESGNAIVDILYGDVNPSAKLPYTIAFDESDYNTVPSRSAVGNSTDPYAWQSWFDEKLEIDYRYFDAHNLSVRYEFGYGLSYTNFTLSSMSIAYLSNETITAAPAELATAPGGNPALWEELYNVTVKLTNVGSVSGAQVPQLYLTMPSSTPAGTPPRQLRGFDKVFLEPNAASVVTFPLMRRDLSYWDIISQEWIIPSGEFVISAGFSSRDIKVTSTLVVI
ncbi:putative beta-glucosidase G [Coleophoma crateriformis]|uniref:Probable beta-glucosidase G n=1 Tax=Coleophoma crateriformis TaxID=565419 RepID=A0A3D8Q8V3_9HELO|nr:putative beta-glucosidase G [Coleophoma crateriformis]